MNTSSSVLLSVRWLFRNSTPTPGRSPKKGIFAVVLRVSCV
jgi:hypothetical protein